MDEIRSTISPEMKLQMDLSVSIANRIYEILESKGMSQKDNLQDICCLRWAYCICNQFGSQVWAFACFRIIIPSRWWLGWARKLTQKFSFIIRMIWVIRGRFSSERNYHNYHNYPRNNTLTFYLTQIPQIPRIFSVFLFLFRFFRYK